MIITGTSFFLIALACLLFFSRSRLYAAMIFFIPFSATAVVNFAAGDSGSGLQASMLFGTLWIFWQLLAIMSAGRLPACPRSNFHAISLLLLFMTVVITSLIMPVIIDGTLQVASPVLFDPELTPLTLNGRHITQTLYLAYGVTIAILISLKNLEMRQLQSSIRIYTLSGVFVSLWGLFQWVLFQMDVPYPDFIFNTNINESAQGYLGLLTETNIKRISSVAVEPSILAQFLLTVLPFIYYAVRFKTPIFSPQTDKIILCLFLTVLALSTATSAYLGFVAMLFGEGILFFKMRRFFSSFMLTVIGALVLTSMAYFISPSVGIVLNEVVFNKEESYSAIARMATVLNSWDYFIEYPILGVGWGSVTSYDLIVGLLATTGIFGFISFVVFILYLLRRMLKAIQENRSFIGVDKNMSMLSAVMVSLITMLLLSAFTGFSYVFGHFWFIVGLAIAIPTVAIRRQHAPLEFGAVSR